MRLWHKYLIPALPRQQLVSQWRECCCIARNLYVNGTPNHILVNKILTYPREHFVSYTKLVIQEMEKRGYNVDPTRFFKYIPLGFTHDTVGIEQLFDNWHNLRYFRQCYYNLQEKYDCYGITDAEWNKIYAASCKMYPVRVSQIRR